MFSHNIPTHRDIYNFLRSKCELLHCFSLYKGNTFLLLSNKFIFTFPHSSLSLYFSFNNEYLSRDSLSYIFKKSISSSVNCNLFFHKISKSELMPLLINASNSVCWCNSLYEFAHIDSNDEITTANNCSIKSSDNPFFLDKSHIYINS